MTFKKGLALVSFLILLILLLIGIILIINFIYNKNETEKKAKLEAELLKVPGYKDDNSKWLNVGNILDVQGSKGFFLTSKIIDVSKNNDQIFLEIETKDSSNKVVEKKLLIYKNGVTKNFFIEKTNSLENISKTKSTKLTSTKEILDKIGKLKNQTIIAYIDLPLSLSNDIYKPYEKYINCNDNFYKFLKDPKINEDNCIGSTLIIYAKE